jgi:hypothetical protein
MYVQQPQRPGQGAGAAEGCLAAWCAQLLDFLMLSQPSAHPCLRSSSLPFLAPGPAKEPIQLA